MSVPEVYITTGIHGTGATARTPAVIRGQITQFFDFNLRVPRKGYRTCDIRVNLYNDELAPLYAGAERLDPYKNFLYVKWRGRIVFWGQITIKEVDFENNSIVLHGFDQGARLEKHYFRIGDEAIDDPKDITQGHLPVSVLGLRLCLLSGEPWWDSTYIPLAIKNGTNTHSSFGSKIKVERGQELWRTMQDLGDRTDGPLFEFEPMDISDGQYFAVMNSFGQIRRDLSSVVKFHHLIGLNNVRSMQLTEGGQVISHTNVLTRNNKWRTLTSSGQAGHDAGVWVGWDNVDWDLANKTTKTEAEAALGAVGDATLDAYGRPLKSVEMILNRDDQMQDNENQFYWLEDFKIADVVEVKGAKGQESFSGKYTIDEIRLEQESDNSGQVRQAVDVLPFVTVGQYHYNHQTLYVDVGDPPS